MTIYKCIHCGHLQEGTTLEESLKCFSCGAEKSMTPIGTGFSYGEQQPTKGEKSPTAPLNLSAEHNTKKRKPILPIISTALSIISLVAVSASLAMNALHSINTQNYESEFSSLRYTIYRLSDEIDSLNSTLDELIGKDDNMGEQPLELSNPIYGEIDFDFSPNEVVFSPTMNDYRTHAGVDILAPLGTEILAPADGVIKNVWDDPFMGTCIIISHSGNIETIYKNLDPTVADGIVIGASVVKGQVIGYVGQSAMNEAAQDPHLHFEIKLNDKHVDPKEYIDFTAAN